MKKTYNNQNEITNELKKLRLKRNISIEEIKLIKHQFKEDLSIISWVQTAVKSLGQLGAYKLAEKILK